MSETNNKLPCYGITARALQILSQSDYLPTSIDLRWFNWTNGNMSRLTLVTSETAGKWSQDVVAAGYHCVFIDAVDDEHCVDDLGLEDGIGYSVLTPTDEERISNQATLTELREPERKVMIYWDSVRQGGGQ